MLIEWLRRNQNLAVPIALLVFSVVLLSAGSYSKRRNHMSRFAKSVLSLASFGQGAVTGTADFFSDTFRRYLWLVGVEKENHQLQTELSELKRKNAVLAEQAIENDRLRRLLNFKPTEEIQSWVPARVIGDDLVGFNKTVIINKGSLDGIKPRMAVITYDSAVVGQILDEPGYSIGFNESQVLLIIDRRSRIQVMVQRPESRARGILVGHSESRLCDLLYVGRLEDVREGDLIISSGFGRILLKGWPVGRVMRVEKDPSSFYPKILVEPMVDFSRLEEVIVIVLRGQS